MAGEKGRPPPASPSSRLLRDQIRTVTRTDNCGNRRVEIVPIEDELSFDKGLFMFIRAVQLLRQSYDVRPASFLRPSDRSRRRRYYYAQ